MHITCGTVKLPVGSVEVAVSEKGICFCGTSRDARDYYVHKHYPNAEITADKKALGMAADALKRWAAGDDISAVPLDIRGTPFQKRVWAALSRIPRGETKTYAEVARMIGQPKAARAVGAACGANPVPFLIPCHRVVASGGIGGFGLGLPVKKRLLALEGACAQAGRVA